jgi:hypothetical protein
LRRGFAILHPRSSILVFENLDDFLARAGFYEFGFGVAQIERGAEELDGFTKTGWRFGFHERAEFRGEFFDRIDAEAAGHAAIGAKGVDGDGKGRDLAVDGGFFEEQRLAAAGEFHFAVGDFGDFEFGGDGLGDAAEFTRLFERPQKFAERIEGHSGESLAEPGGHAMAPQGEAGIGSRPIAERTRRLAPNFPIHAISPAHILVVAADLKVM